MRPLLTCLFAVALMVAAACDDEPGEVGEPDDEDSEGLTASDALDGMKLALRDVTSVRSEGVRINEEYALPDFLRPSPTPTDPSGASVEYGGLVGYHSHAVASGKNSWLREDVIWEPMQICSGFDLSCVASILDACRKARRGCIYDPTEFLSYEGKEYARSEGDGWSERSPRSSPKSTPCIPDRPSVNEAVEDGWGLLRFADEPRWLEGQSSPGQVHVAAVINIEPYPGCETALRLTGEADIWLDAESLLPETVFIHDTIYEGTSMLVQESRLTVLL